MSFSRIWYEYCLLVLKAILPLCCIACFALGCGSESREPSVNKIEWIDYDPTSVQANVELGRPVFVFVFSELNPASAPLLKAVSSAKLSKLCSGDNYAAYELRYKNWDDLNFQQITSTVGFSKEPFILFYPTGGPPVALEPISLDRLHRNDGDAE